MNSVCYLHLLVEQASLTYHLQYRHRGLYYRLQIRRYYRICDTKSQLSLTPFPNYPILFHQLVWNGQRATTMM